MAFTSTPLVCDAWALVTNDTSKATMLCPMGSARIVCGDVTGQPINVGIPMSAGEKLVIPAGLQVWACGAGAECWMLSTPFSA